MFGRILLLLSLPLAFCATLTVHLPPSSPDLPNPNVLPASTTATLTTSGHHLRTPLTRSNTFRFSNITAPGSYLLDIHSRDHVFAPYRVDVADEDGLKIVGVWETYRGNEWDNKGQFIGRDAVEAKILGRRAFYEKREGFDPTSLLKNPMILLAGVAMVLMFGMPYLMENMDPEMKAEFEEAQKNNPMSGMARSVTQGPGAGAPSFDLAGWMAGAQSGGASGSEGTASGRDAGTCPKRRG